MSLWTWLLLNTCLFTNFFGEPIEMAVCWWFGRLFEKPRFGGMDPIGRAGTPAALWPSTAERILLEMFFCHNIFVGINYTIIETNPPPTIARPPSPKQMSQNGNLSTISINAPIVR